ncbi:MAG: O-antigen ligase family protein [Pseudanabaenaceae cyanobacterium]
MSDLHLWLELICLGLPFNNILSTAWGLIGIGYSAWLYWQGKIKLYPLEKLVHRLWIALALWLLLSLLFAPDRLTALLGLLDFIPFMVFAIVVSHLAKGEEGQERIARNLVISSIPISLFGLFQVIFNRPDLHLPRLFSSYIIPLGKSSDGRILSLFGHFNELGIFLVMVLPLMVYFINHSSGKDRWIGLVALPIGLICLYFSGSRNAWAVATIGCLILSLYYRFWLGTVAILSIVVTLVAAVWLPWAEGLRVLFPRSLVARLASTFDPSRTDFFSTSSRWNAWQIAVDLINQRPITGWGLRNFPIVAKMQGKDLMGLPHEHNLYLSIATGSGLIGLGLFLASVLLPLLPKREELPLRFMFRCSVGLYLLSCILDITLYEPRISLLFWLFLGVLTA